MTDPFLAEIRMFGGNFAPRGWALCNGQLMSISQNTALFSLLGTTYGGDGRVTFGLPNLMGTAPIVAFAPAPNLQLNTAAVANAGGSQPHNNESPYLVLNFIIALVGIYPSRN